MPSDSTKLLHDAALATRAPPTDDRELANLLAIADDVVKRTRAGGADVAEVVMRSGSELSARVRLGEPELVEEAGHRGIGMRLMKRAAGGEAMRVALTSTSDTTDEGISRFIDDALELVELSQPDPFAGPPDEALLASGPWPDLDLYDDACGSVDAAEAIRRATIAEAAARAFDKRITNSEGASFGRSQGGSVIVTSGGFRGGYRGSYASLTVTPLADEEGSEKKRRGYHWTARRKLAALDGEKEVGEEAARRTLRKLGARKVATAEVPVVFDPDAGRSILGLLAGCIGGGAIYRKSSYLVDREGSVIASNLVHVVDDPLIAGAPGSRPFDGEGLASRTQSIVENGVLTSYLIDSYSGRKLGKASTATASRGSGGGVGASTSNFVLRPGTTSGKDVVKSTKSGLYVTEMMGFGFNAVTGDFSRGASGFWIENGEFAYPVSEVTISLNLDQLLQRIDLVGDDLDMRTSIATPTFRVSSMTLAGS
ncbi:MAG: TldD/PmbA family protein [Polyangiales bacterium]